MKDAVGHGVHRIALEQAAGGAVSLDQMESGLAGIGVVAVELRPPRQVVAAKIGVQVAQVGNADVAIVGHAGGADRFDDQRIHAIGRARAAADVGIGNLAVQPRIAGDDRHQLIQARAGRAIDVGIHRRVVQRVTRQLAGQKLAQPLRHLGELRIRRAVLVQKLAIADVEGQVVDAIGHGVHRVALEQAHARPVVLDQMKSGFLSVFVIAVQQRECRQMIGPQPGVHVVQVGGTDVAIVGHSGGPDRLHDQHVHAIGGGRAAVDVGRRCPAGQPGVLGDEADQLIDSGAGAADGFDERGGAGCCRGDGHGFLGSCVMEFLLLPAGLCFRGSEKPARQPPAPHLRPTDGRSKRFTCRRRSPTVGQRRQPVA